MRGFVLGLVLAAALSAPAMAAESCWAKVETAAGSLTASGAGVPSQFGAEWTPATPLPSTIRITIDETVFPDGATASSPRAGVRARLALPPSETVRHLRMEVAFDGGPWEASELDVAGVSERDASELVFKAWDLFPSEQVAAARRISVRFTGADSRTFGPWTVDYDAAARDRAVADIRAKIAADRPAYCRTIAITQPPWTKRPTLDQVRRVYPDKAWRKRLSGRVVMSCNVAADGALAGCSIVTESPPGEDFGKAALKLAPLYRMNPKTPDGAPVAGAVVRIPVTFIHE